MNGWPRVASTLAQVDRSLDAVIDYSDGARWAWWLWLANKGHTREFAADGVTRVSLAGRNRKAFLQIETVTSAWRVELPKGSSNKKMIYYQLR